MSHAAERPLSSSIMRPPPMPALKAATLALAMALVVLGTRLPWIHGAGTGEVRNMDEPLMYHAAVMRVFGLPTEALAWPGGPLRLFAQGWTLWQMGAAETGGGPGGAMTRLADLVASPWEGVTALRWFVAACGSVGISLLAIPVARRTGSRMLGAAAALALAVCPYVWFRSGMGVGDALSWALMAAAVAFADGLHDGRGRPAWTGALVGMAMSAKLTAFVGLPLILALLWQRSDRRFRAWLVMGLMMPAGFCLGSPELMTQTIGTLKSLAANAAMRSGTAGWATVAGAFTEAVPVWLALAAALGVLGLAWSRQGSVLVGSVLSFALALAMTIRAPVVQPHYYGTLCVVGVFAAFVGLTGPMRAELRRRGSTWRWMGQAGLALAMAAVVVNGWAWQGRLESKHRARYEGVFALREALREMKPTGPVLAPMGALTHLMDDASGRSLLALAERCESRMLDGQSVAGVVKQGRLPEAVGMAVPSVFNSPEQGYAARLRLVGVTRQDRPGLDLRVWSTHAFIGDRFALLTRGQAIEQFHRGQAEVLVLDAVVEGLVPAADLGGEADFRIVVYRRGDQPRPAATQP